MNDTTFSESWSTYVIWITSVLDGRDHAVIDGPTGTDLGQGQYPALCGHVITPHALAAPPGRRCQHCVVTVNVISTRPRPTPRWLRALSTFVRKVGDRGHDNPTRR